MNPYIYSLVLDAKEGDPKAFEQLYIQYKDKVYALALATTKSASEAEEATRLTFIQVFRQVGSLQDTNAFDIWLRYIALNESNALRQSNNRYLDENEVSDPHAERIEDDFLMPQDYIERDDLSYRMRMIIDGLPRIRRQTLILSLYDSEMTDIGTNTMKIVFVETDGIRDSSAGSAAVVPSGRKMGEALGEMLLKKSGPAPYVSVLIRNLLRYSEKEMLQGLTETVEGAGGSILLIETDREYMMTALTRSKEADAIAVLEDPLLMRAAELSVSEELPGGRLFGIGCSPSNISYLDRGVISGMIIPNEFTMGYQSLAQLSRCLSNDIPVMKDIEIGFSGVLTEEVHDPENEKLLFPVVQ